MDKEHRRKLIIALVTLQLVFLLVFALAFYNQTKDHALLAIGLPAAATNFIIMGFCALSMLNVIIEIIRVR